MSNELSTVNSQEEFLDSLIQSGKLPVHIKTVQDAITIAQMGKELGFPVMQAFHYIIPIQGKLSLSAKAIGAILRKGGVTYNTLEDALYVYKDGSTAEYNTREDQKPIDRRTTILFKRPGQQDEKVSFTWKDAEGQNLTSKDNWKRMPKEMLFARCIAKGSNRIAPDLLLGLYSADELADAFNVSERNIIREEDGTLRQIVDIEHSETK